MLLAQILKTWGDAGWASHVAFVKVCGNWAAAALTPPQDMYRNRRDTFVELANAHLRGKAQFNVPDAGMFVWFTLPNIADSSALIQEKAREKKVLMVPGAVFMPDDRVSNWCSVSTACLGRLTLAVCAPPSARRPRSRWTRRCVAWAPSWIRA